MLEELRPEFHLKDGWYFRRQPDGGMLINIRANADPESPLVAQYTFGAKQWADLSGSAIDLYRLATQIERLRNA